MDWVVSLDVGGHIPVHSQAGTQLHFAISAARFVQRRHFFRICGDWLDRVSQQQQAG